jgi:alpha-L-fucosidase
MGGNLLLDIGPKADGTIPKEQAHLLKELGRWTRKHAEAIYGTTAGMPAGHFYGPTTLSKDSTTLYLFVNSTAAKNISIKGLDNAIVSAEILGSNQTLAPQIVGKISWSHVPGLVYLEIPESAQDTYVTVVKIKLKGKLKLYRGKGGFE